MTTDDLPECCISPKRITGSGKVLKIVATKTELLLISPLLGVDKVKSLTANIDITPWGGNGFSISADVNVSLVQTCVVTLDPLHSDINMTFVRHFVPQENSRNVAPDIVDGEMILDPLEDDLPDVLEGNSLNLWEVILEELNLEIDPYPRTPDFMDDVKQPLETEAGDQQMHRPFESLDKLISTKKTGK